MALKDTYKITLSNPLCTWCVIMLCMTYNQYSYSQDALHRSFVHAGIEDGLPNFSVTSVVSDPLGYLWVGTLDGLARYDGYSYEMIESITEDGKRLPDNYVKPNALYFDLDGTLWIGTLEGLARRGPCFR